MRKFAIRFEGVAFVEAESAEEALEKWNNIDITADGAEVDWCDGDVDDEDFVDEDEDY